MSMEYTDPKAFIVTGDDGAAAIIFARHAVVARREGACELGTEFSYVESCRRAPEFDSWAELGRVPSFILVEKHGWQFECSYCYSMVSADTDGWTWEGGHHVFCSQRCRGLFRKRAKENESCKR